MGDSLRHFVIGVDFGTTFSSVSVLAQRTRAAKVDPDKIISISNYPSSTVEYSQAPKEVPTESWYPRRLPQRPSLNRSADEYDEDSSEESSDSDVSIKSESSYESVSDEESESDSSDGSTESGSTESDDSTVANTVDYMDEDNGAIDRYYWGYTVSQKLSEPDISMELSRRIARSKLLLDLSEHTRYIRQLLKNTVNDLCRGKLVRDETDVIADYLAHLFLHTKSQMSVAYQYNEACPVEFVLTVPAMWTERARRIMQNAMTRALRDSGFIRGIRYDIDNLFIVTEPEAAATYVLATTDEILPNDCFILLDAGGGTVDAITYKVRKLRPLRLEREEVEPAGALCGSSYLNEAFERVISERLKKETYLERDNVKIEGIVNDLVQQFETKHKRHIDIYSRLLESEHFFIQGLLPSQGKKFRHNRLYLDQEDLKDIFKPCLEGVSNLMFSQMEQARAKGVTVKKVILIGGFAASPSLVSHLQRRLERYHRMNSKKVELIRATVPGCAVAHGAILRALEKEDGPERRLRSSYGLLRTEPYQPDIVRAHIGKYPWTDPLDGSKYIKNTIEWIVNKGDLLPSGTRIIRPVTHTFPVSPDEPFLCKEVFYVSDKHHDSNYRRNHPKNKGATEEGHIIVDMSYLKKDPSFKPVVPGPGEKGQPHYLVEYDLVIIVDGRNLRFVAHPQGQDGAIKGERRISIAAAFQPGTD
ncbi:hypothetical protein BDV25DRAFT_119620 [Aspergillus avenaceus]|uniref:Uncharacterized protein n=1 Tax=Aspergillus avenaceus TaxID=36643 RepID=A0A5N6TU82_ASPAV|nr:hypothetical protein BDV25DRAFT_119620 [Aspergillus avenaceus]